MSEKGTARGHGDGLVAGERIEEFEIVRELGFGGFGITYLARDHALARLVAVKEYFPGDWGTRRADGTIAPRSATTEADYAWGLDRFVDEARVLARLTHHNIVRVYRIVEAAGSAYMAMEYVEGHSLAEELKSSGPLPERRVRRLLAGLAEGLAAVHAAGLLHRDIKPANVMLREGDGSPVLIDFGAAREQLGRKSQSITSVLTPGYAPIEQYSTKGRQGPWTDLYALGAVAYAALSGRVPDDATERTLNDELAPVETVAASPVGAETAAAVMTALEVYPDRRPRDVSEWLAVLRGGEGAKAAVVAARGVGTAAAEPARPARQRAVSSPKPGGRRAGTAGPKWPLWVGGGTAAAVVALLVWLAGGGSGGGGEVPSEAALPDPDSLAAVVEEALGLERSEVQRIQRGLLEAGFDPGEGDGLIGVGTREALRRWQTERGFETTGYLGVNAADVFASGGLEAFLADTAAQEERLAAERREASAQRLAEERRPGRRFRDCAECPEMVVVPPGSLMMGSPDPEADRDGDEGPRHRVTIGYSFGVGVYEVTFAEWDACVAAGGCGYRPEDEGWGRASRPVIHVSWEDAREYVRWLSQETGEEYRLLSEAEWEYVARGGTETARYWGESESAQCRYENGYDRTADAETDESAEAVDCSDGYAYTAPVGVYEANAFGLYDVLGSVHELTEDCWTDHYLGAPVDGSAWRSGDCSRRVMRGGGWDLDPGYLRSAARMPHAVGHRSNSDGFRVARPMN